MKHPYIRTILSLLLTLTIVLSFPAVVSATSASLEGDGSEASPYLIKNKADLAYFKDNAEAGKCYKLTADIVWSSYTDASDSGSTNWEPVAFSGTFDGDGHSISGLYVSRTSTDGTALFSTAEGTIKNLTIKDSYFEGNTNVAGFVGKFAESETTSLTVENCVNYAKIVGNVKNTNIGGIMGNVNRFTNGIKCSFTFRRCVNYGSVTSKTLNAYAGGIVGVCNAYQLIIDECANFGDITGVTALVGGITSQIGGKDNNYTDGERTIRNCVNYGKVEAVRVIGGIVGRAYANSKVENCVNYGTVTASFDDATNENSKQWGAIVGNISTDPLGDITNCFYLNGCAKNSSVPDAVSYVDSVLTGKTVGKDAADMTVSGLGLSADIWANDTENNGRLTMKYLVSQGSGAPTETTTSGSTAPVTPTETTSGNANPSPSTGDGSAILLCAIAAMAVCALGVALLPRKKTE